MTEVYSLHSEQGDEYKLQFTTERTAMFKRYVSQQQQLDVCDDEIRIDGVAEPFFFHLIYHRQHQYYAEMIAEGHAKDFGKPEEA